MPCVGLRVIWQESGPPPVDTHGAKVRSLWRPSTAVTGPTQSVQYQTSSCVSNQLQPSGTRMACAAKFSRGKEGSEGGQEEVKEKRRKCGRRGCEREVCQCLAPPSGFTAAFLAATSTERPHHLLKMFFRTSGVQNN